MKDLAQLILRLALGGLMAGHGAQKLFGAFGGGGLPGTEKMMDKMGFQPADRWALAAAGTEFAGGSLTALGLLSPLGPLAVVAPMVVATGTAHAGKPIWSSQGGAELPVTNLAIAGALFLAGPGAISLDRVFGIKVPWWFSTLALAGTVGGIAVAVGRKPAPRAMITPAPAERPSSNGTTTPAPKPIEKATPVRPERPAGAR
jgi:putative oxidoreductase